MRERWVVEGFDGYPDFFLLREAEWRAARCACSLDRLVPTDNPQVAVIGVVIEFGADARPARLEGSVRFDIGAGMLEEIELEGRDDRSVYTLAGTRTLVVRATPPEAAK